MHHLRRRRLPPRSSRPVGRRVMNTRLMFARLLRGIAELPVERVIREHLLFHALAGLGQVPAVAYAASLADAADASDEPGLIRFAEVAAGEIFAKVSADSAVAGLVTPASALFPVLVDGAVGQCIPAEGVAGRYTGHPTNFGGEEVAGLAGPVTSGPWPLTPGGWS